MTTTHARSLWQDWRRLGDERAFENLVSREVPYAADLTRRMGASPGEADDAVQEALLQLAREASDVPVDVGVRAFLCRRAALAFKMHVRASGRRRTYERAAPVGPATVETDGPVELGQSVNEALEALPADLRLAVVLRHMHDMDYGEIAHVLGTSRNAARLRVFRGLRALRTRLGADAATMVAMVGVPGFATTLAPAGVASTAVATTATATTATATTATATTATATTIGTIVTSKTALGVAAAVVAAGGAAVILGDPQPTPPEEPTPVVAAPPPVEETRPEPPRAPEPPRRRGLELLQQHLAGTRDATATLWDVDAVDALLGKAGGKTVRARGTAHPFSLGTLAEDAGRIEFGEGTYTIDGPLRAGHRGVLELVGAGRDKTTLQIRGGYGIQAHGDLAGLRVRDMTIEGGTFLAVYGRVAATFERVRFRGWLDRGGHGAPIGINGAALLALRDCAFLGGYGRRPGGTGLSVRGASLALFEGCTFRDVEYVVANGHPGDPHPRGIGHFRACRFEASPLVRRDDREADAYPMRVRGGRIAFGLERFPRERRLAALGADRVEIGADVTLAPEPARVTLAAVRAALAALPLAPDEVIALEVRRHAGAEGPRFIAYARDGRRMRVLEVYAWQGGRLVPLPSGAERVGHAPALAPGRGKNLQTLLDEAWPTLDPDESSGGVALHRTTDGKAVLVLLDRFARQRRW